MTREYATPELKELCKKLKGLGTIQEYFYQRYNRVPNTWTNYTKPESETGGIYYSSLRELGADALVTEDCMFEPRYMSYSDYSGIAVERSNCEVFLELFGKTPGVHEFTGDLGTRGVSILLVAITEEMLEVFNGLTDLPVMDDDALSTLEMEMEDEDWDSWIRGDLLRGLRKKFPHLEDEIERLDSTDGSDGLWSLYRELCERTNTNWYAESAVSGYVDIDQLVAGALESDIKTGGE